MAWGTRGKYIRNDEHKKLMSHALKKAYAIGSAKKHSKKYTEAAFNVTYNKYLQSAKIRKIPFELTKGEFLELTQQNCFYCGAEPSNCTSGVRPDGRPRFYGEFIYSGIDRINAEHGYIKENCVPSCKNCNIGKGTQTAEEFLAWICAVYKHLMEE